MREKCIAMPESFKTRLARWGFNLFPAFRGTGARITYIAGDWRELHVKLPFSWRTRNYVGTIFGGSMYASVDPMYMLMLIKVLGPEYVVWDKAAAIRFRKPARGALCARFVLRDEELRAIEAGLAEEPHIDRNYLVDLVDAEGVVHASVEKTIYIQKKEEVSPLSVSEEASSDHRGSA